MCLYPKLITNPKYKANKKNGGKIPAVLDERVRLVPIGCGKCMECRKQKAREWQVRLLEDIKTNKGGKFITLTFSNSSIKKLSEDIEADRIKKRTKLIEEYNETLDNNTYLEIEKLEEKKGYELDNAIATKAMRMFLERWRKKYKKSLRHWMITELGHNGTENIHLHGIIWTDNEKLKELDNIWQYGHVWKGKEINGQIQNYVNGQTVSYITKYVTKIDEKHKYYKGVILTSAGIGRNYTNTYDSTKNKFNDKNTIETYRTSSGHKIAMPIYWRNKIYSETEREKLWLIKLDKEERWVCGEKIKIKNGDETEYYKLLEHYRRLNRQLGYGDDKLNWERKAYEESRRTIMQRRRMSRAEREELAAMI
ncbi:MAG: replication initiator protein [Microviridae sp.]|nr:MAG: replication initiator protein [Microviridae sp.]